MGKCKLFIVCFEIEKKKKNCNKTTYRYGPQIIQLQYNLQAFTLELKHKHSHTDTHIVHKRHIHRQTWGSQLVKKKLQSITWHMDLCSDYSCFQFSINYQSYSVFCSFSTLIIVTVPMLCDTASLFHTDIIYTYFSMVRMGEAVELFPACTGPKGGMLILGTAFLVKRIVILSERISPNYPKLEDEIQSITWGSAA